MSELARLDATGQAELVRDGLSSPAELVESAIGRIEALNPELNAVISDLSDKTIAAAAKPLPDGPFQRWWWIDSHPGEPLRARGLKPSRGRVSLGADFGDVFSARGF